MTLVIFSTGCRVCSRSWYVFNIFGFNFKRIDYRIVFFHLPATGKTGRFTLIERWRNNERLLAPNESPLKV